MYWYQHVLFDPNLRQVLDQLTGQVPSPHDIERGKEVVEVLKRGEIYHGSHSIATVGNPRNKIEGRCVISVEDGTDPFVVERFRCARDGETVVHPEEIGSSRPKMSSTTASRCPRAAEDAIGSMNGTR